MATGGTIKDYVRSHILNSTYGGATNTDIFRIFDDNQDGWISADEFQNKFSRHGVHLDPKVLQLFWEEFDQDLNGRLEINEFKRFMNENVPTVAESRRFRPIDPRFVRAAGVPVRMPQEYDEHKRGTFGSPRTSLPTSINPNRCALEEIKAARHRFSMNDFGTTGSVFQKFARFDLDGDGFISQDELQLKLEEVGLHASLHDFSAIFEAMDDDGDGQISRNDFGKFLSQPAKVGRSQKSA